MEDRAREYSNVKYRLAVVDMFLTLALLLLLQFSGFNVRLKNILQNISAAQQVLTALYSITIFIIYSALTFFLDFYRSFVIEHRFALTKQGIPSWGADYLKSNLLGLLMFVVLMESFFYFIRNHSAYWWWMSALFWIFLTVVIARIFPIVIIPLFFKYKKLENEDLRRRILDLAARMRVKILDVFEIDFSKKSLKANAAFVGIGRSKRVLLTDTLLGGRFQSGEIEMILSHEFAHYRLRHMIKMIAMSSFLIFLSFYVFFELNNRLFASLGLAVWDISNIGIWLFLFMALQILCAPLHNFISRNMEKNADMAAIKVSGDTKHFISMMEKLGEQNLSDPHPPLWAKIMFYDHPPIDERIAYARKGCK